jgi:hypothetical protein
MNWAHGPWTGGRLLSTVDFCRGMAVGSPEHGLAGDVMGQSLPWMLQNGEGSSPIHIGGSNERRRGIIGLVTERSIQAVVVLGDKVLWARRSSSNSRDGN